MIPYVSCMLVFVGMFFHFIQMLVSFLRRKAREVPVVATPVNPYDEAVDVAKAKGFQDVEVAAPVTETRSTPNANQLDDTHNRCWVSDHDAGISSL